MNIKNIEKQKKNKINAIAQNELNKEHFVTLLPWICLVAAYLAAVLFQLIFGEQLLNSDMSGEIILANKLNEGDGFVLSRSWYYSTELRVLYQHLTLQLGLLIFPHNWHLARTISQAIMLAIYAACYLFLAHECNLKKIGVISAAILMCPFGFWYMWYGTYNGAYLTPMLFVCFDLAMILHISKNEKHRLFFIVLLLILSFMEGLNGVRMLMNFYVPMTVAAVIIIFICIQKKPLEKPFSKNSRLWLIKTTIFATVSCAAGYLVNAKVLAQSYYFYTYEAPYWRQFEFSNLLDAWSMFLRIFGYPYHENWTMSDTWTENYLFSVTGILGSLGLGLMLAVIFSALRLLFQRDKLSFAHFTVLIAFWSCFIIDSIVYSCLEDAESMNSSYWLPIVPLAIAVVAIEIKTEHFRIPALRRTVIAVILACAFCAGVSTSYRFLKFPPRTIAGLEEVGEWLVENGWTKGYASFWAGDMLTELTDGEVEVWVVTDVASLTIYPVLQSTSHDTAPEGKVFVLFQYDDSMPYYSYDNLLYIDENGWVILGYDSADQLYEIMEQSSEDV